MKRTIFLIGWVLITCADGLMGFRTATGQFGFSTAEAVVWAAGFAMMSIPLKVIYDRLVHQLPKGWGSHIGFGLFSALWLYLAFRALAGLADGRAVLQTQAALTTLQPVIQSRTDTIYRPKTRLALLAYRARLQADTRLDSLRQQSALAMEEKVLQARLLSAQSAKADGFLYLTLLLVLSGAVVLNGAFEDPSVAPPPATADLPLRGTSGLDRRAEDNGFTYTDRPTLVPLATSVPPPLPGETAGSVDNSYVCPFCQKPFGNRQQLAAHYRFSIACREAKNQQA